MSDEPRVYMTTELTPDRVRQMQFETQDRGFSRADVLQFLDQVASALEVLQNEKGDAVQQELERISGYTSSMVAAAQQASGQLREQAQNDAREILEDARRQAREAHRDAEASIEQTRSALEAARIAFVDELRELYERIGASLFRFEQAAEAADGAAEEMKSSRVAEPGESSSGTKPAGPRVERSAEAATPPSPPAPQPVTLSDEEAWEDEQPSGEPLGSELDGPSATGDPESPFDEPAAPSMAEPTTAPEPVAPSTGGVIDLEPSYDEPDEPLVDLSQLQQPESPSSAPEQQPPAPHGGMPPLQPAPESMWGEQPTEGGVGLQPQAPDNPFLQSPAPDQPAPPAPAPDQPPPMPAPDQPAPPMPAPDPPATPMPAPDEPDPAAQADDARAEELLKGIEQVFAQPASGNEPPPPPQPQPLPVNGATEQDYATLQHFIQQLLMEGSPREAIEAHLRDNYGVPDPAGLIDHIMSQQQLQQQQQQQGGAPPGP